MKLIFKTNTYGFYIEITNSLIAKRIKDCLPLDSKVIKHNDVICFNIYNLDVALEDSSLCPTEGDVIWDYNNNTLCICLGVYSNRDIVLKGIKAGRALASPNEMNQLNNNEKVSISFLEDKKSSSDSRILSQNEIDNLVKELLSSKGRK